MSVRANPTVIGAFVLGACILLVVGLLLWGGTGMFKPRARFVMYFDAAVTGLQKGAPVLAKSSIATAPLDLRYVPLISSADDPVT